MIQRGARPARPRDSAQILVDEPLSGNRIPASRPHSSAPKGAGHEKSMSCSLKTMLCPFIFLTMTSSAVRSGKPRRSARAT